MAMYFQPMVDLPVIRSDIPKMGRRVKSMFSHRELPSISGFVPFGRALLCPQMDDRLKAPLGMRCIDLITCIKSAADQNQICDFKD